MQKTRLLLSMTIIIDLLIIACNLPFYTRQENTNQIITSVAQTADAAKLITPEPQIQATSTIPSLPTLSASATNTPLPTSTIELPSPISSSPCNQAIMISETVMDGSPYTINTAFNKSWRIKNVGSCTWNTNYKIAFLSGDAMSGPFSQNFSTSVAPGEMMDLILPLKAPATKGIYTGYWGLYDDSDVYFGKLWVVIKSIAPDFTVTSVTTSVDASSAICPHTYNFSANITTSAAGTVTYHWRFSNDGGVTITNATTQSITFSAAGTQTVTYNPSFSSSGNYSVNVYIDAPNRQNFEGVTVTCLP